jgi:subfamily B ATP-binding cassette protein MsbA
VRDVIPRALRSPKVLSIAGLLRPHWIAMTLALLGVAGEAGASLLEPWPLKIVLDHVLQSKPLPGWTIPILAAAGGGPLAVLNLAVIGVAVIAVAGAVSAYGNTALTASVGQWVMHDLRRTLYHHIHRLSLAEHDEKRTGDLIGRVTNDIDSIQNFVTAALLGMVTSALTLLGIIGVML